MKLSNDFIVIIVMSCVLSCIFMCLFMSFRLLDVPGIGLPGPAMQTDNLIWRFEHFITKYSGSNQGLTIRLYAVDGLPVLSID